MITTIVTGSRATIAACAAVVLTAVTAGCASHHSGDNSGSVALATAAPSATITTAVPAGTDGELSVGETPWWQLPPTPPVPSPSPGGDPPPQHFVLSGGVLFEPNSPALTPSAGTQLGVILAQVQAHPGARMTVDGFTNANGGLESTAVTLSVARAATVKAWFVANGIPTTQITTHGWGDSHPIYPHPTNDTERAANRRCEITVSAGAP